jgi:hypothetical protein
MRSVVASLPKTTVVGLKMTEAGLKMTEAGSGITAGRKKGL